MELKTRYYLAILVFVLNTINFYFGQERFSSKPKCLAKQSPFKCHHLIYTIFIILAIVDLTYFGYLEKIGLLTDRFPKYWWMGLVAFAIAFYYNEFTATQYVNFECDGKPEAKCEATYECKFYPDKNICGKKYIQKPAAFLSRNVRIIIALVVLFVYLLTFFKEFNNNWYTSSPKLGWLRILSIPTIVVYIWALYNHRNCDFNLPTNWK